MNLLLTEIRANFEQFSSNWQKELSVVITALSEDEAPYLLSYTRLTSLQAWRQHLDPLISADSLAFFLEAQNDALTSHVFARAGSWRSSLKALRSCIDNVLFCCYYMDHAVELELWSLGRHKPTFSELFSYLDDHPRSSNIPEIGAVALLRAEYSTLSKAVHASAKGFRMTKDIKETQLWTASKVSRDMWVKREQNVLSAVNLLLTALFRETLQGAAATGLRDVVALAIPKTKFAAIKKNLGVVLQSPPTPPTA